MYLTDKCSDKFSEDILRRGLLSIANFDECRHECRKILTRKCLSHSGKCHSSDIPQKVFDESLMERYTDSHSRITRFFDKGIGLLECITEVWIVVHISQAIVP